MTPQDAELVAVGIGHDDPVDVALADVDPGRAERHETVDLGVLLGLVERRDIEVHRFLPSFGATGGPPQAMIGPVPSGARIAVSSS